VVESLPWPVVFLVADFGRVRPGDLQDVGAVLGEGARTVGPARTRVRSSTRTPDTAIAVGELSGGLSPIFTDFQQR